MFGTEAAAQYYFKRLASQLTVGQAARLAATLPAPKCFDRKSYRANVHVSFTHRATVIANHMDSATLPD